MKKIPNFLLRCGLIAFAPMTVHAAGTYYNTGYQQQAQARYNANPSTYSSPRSGYSQYQGSASSYKRGGAVSANPNAAYNTRAGYAAGATSAQSSARYNAQNSNVRTRSQLTQSPQVPSRTGAKGFWVDAGISHEFASWKFDMVSAGSMLHYDNVAWNVLDVRGGYEFDFGKRKAQIDLGFKYGMQSGESTMVDDDITNGGYLVDSWYSAETQEWIGDQIGHALSVGASDGGNMLGFNAGFSIRDFFKAGNLRMSPSVGFRYLKYKLETKKNYGLAVDTAACFEVDGEVQCDPALIFVYANGESIIFRDNIKEDLKVPGGNPEYVDTAGTYYYAQPGVSHSYEVEWAGPYIAMDMDYTINQNNAVNARVELGMPGYTATGDQPYRFDWQHPKSVEDEKGMFGAFHLGLGANYVTALNSSVSLSFGFTFDYYTVSGADASTYLNQNYYNTLYNDILNSEKWDGNEAAMLGQVEGVNGDGTAIAIKQLEADCPGWVCKATSEIDSIYKSMGIRVGINAKF